MRPNTIAPVPQLVEAAGVMTCVGGGVKPCDAWDAETLHYIYSAVDNG